MSFNVGTRHNYKDNNSRTSHSGLLHNAPHLSSMVIRMVGSTTTSFTKFLVVSQTLNQTLDGLPCSVEPLYSPKIAIPVGHQKRREHAF